MQRTLVRPLHLAVIGAVWLLAAAAFWGAGGGPADMRVAGRVLTFDGDPIPNEKFVVVHDWQAQGESWVRTTVLELATDATGAYSAELPGKGHHTLTLLHDGQSARRHIHVTRPGAGVARADLPLRNASWGGREPHDIGHLLRRAQIGGDLTRWARTSLRVGPLPAGLRHTGLTDG